MGLTPFTSLLMPTAKVRVIGAVDMPLWLVSAAYFLFDSANLDNKDSQIGHAAHIGGAIFGAAYYLYSYKVFPWLETLSR